MTLANANRKDSFIVKEINYESKMKKRLQDMGLTRGARIKVLSNNTNGAFVLNIRGSRVVLGKGVIENIQVDPTECTTC